MERSADKPIFDSGTALGGGKNYGAEFAIGKGARKTHD